MQATSLWSAFMIRFIKSMLGLNRVVVTITFKNSREERKRMRVALSEGFISSWNGSLWVLTKVINT